MTIQRINMFILWNILYFFNFGNTPGNAPTATAIRYVRNTGYEKPNTRPQLSENIDNPVIIKNADEARKFLFKYSFKNNAIEIAKNG